jgi:hypothetical protein
MNLWDQLVEYFKQVIAVTRRVDGHDADIDKLRENDKAMQAEIRSMAASILDLEYQVQQVRENAVHEREKLLLRLDNILLRAGVDQQQNRLPNALPPPPED